MNFSKNPILPLEYFIPDVEARIFNDRLYMYGSFDIMDNTKYYCSHKYHVFSSADGISFTDHGVCFTSDDVPWTDELLFAPDCICKDGKYFLYFCTQDGTIGVAVSDRPEGPFSDAVKLDTFGIDPGVFIDDDGQAYLYWGQFDDVRAAKLSDDMLSVIPETVMQPLSVKEHFFHEGSSMRKRGDTYYYVFADESRKGAPTSLGYATSDNPLTGFKYQGIIIDNFGCDPQSWNNHGSIIEWRGQWYVFYHRSTGNSKVSRRVCVEKIEFDENGLIKEIPMSSAGFANLLTPGDANIVSYMTAIGPNGTYARRNGVEVLSLTGNSKLNYNKISTEGKNSINLEVSCRASAEFEICGQKITVSEGTSSITATLKDCGDKIIIDVTNFVGDEITINKVFLA